MGYKVQDVLAAFNAQSERKLRKEESEADRKLQLLLSQMNKEHEIKLRADEREFEIDKINLEFERKAGGKNNVVYDSDGWATGFIDKTQTQDNWQMNYEKNVDYNMQHNLGVDVNNSDFLAKAVNAHQKSYDSGVGRTGTQAIDSPYVIDNTIGAITEMDLNDLDNYINQSQARLNNPSVATELYQSGILDFNSLEHNGATGMYQIKGTLANNQDLIKESMDLANISLKAYKDGVRQSASYMNIVDYNNMEYTEKVRAWEEADRIVGSPFSVGASKKYAANSATIRTALNRTVSSETGATTITWANQTVELNDVIGAKGLISQNQTLSAKRKLNLQKIIQTAALVDGQNPSQLDDVMRKLSELGMGPGEGGAILLNDLNQYNSTLAEVLYRAYDNWVNLESIKQKATNFYGDQSAYTSAAAMSQFDSWIDSIGIRPMLLDLRGMDPNSKEWQDQNKNLGNLLTEIAKDLKKNNTIDANGMEIWGDAGSEYTYNQLMKWLEIEQATWNAR